MNGIRIPVRLLEDVYGVGNFDDAGDDLVALLRSCFGERFQVEFDFDTAHANPWFHDFILQVRGLREDEVEELKRLLMHRGLVE